MQLELEEAGVSLVVAGAQRGEDTIVPWQSPRCELDIVPVSSPRRITNAAGMLPSAGVKVKCQCWPCPSPSTASQSLVESAPPPSPDAPSTHASDGTPSESPTRSTPNVMGLPA